MTTAAGKTDTWTICHSVVPDSMSEKSVFSFGGSYNQREGVSRAGESGKYDLGSFSIPPNTHRHFTVKYPLYDGGRRSRL